jgi:flagellar hook protein FlgE
MSFYTSLSGLQAAQTDMSTISHNLANVATNGFKKSRTEFADVIASSVSLSPTKMVGSGTVVKGNYQQFGEGSLTTSTSSLDLAMSGDGFFIVKPDPDAAGVDFTRNGGFAPDADGNVVDSNGGHLQVYPVDGDGAVVATGIDSTISLKLPATSGTPVSTKNVALSVNLNASSSLKDGTTFNRFDASTYTQSAKTTVYDASGNPLTLTNYYVRTKAPTTTDPTSTWQVYSYVGDQQLTTGGGSTAPTTLTFDQNGTMTAPTTATAFDAFTPAGSTAPQSLSEDFGASTQAASPFTVLNRTQDGAAVGQLQGVTVDSNGLITASFSNGDTQPLGMVALANFNNPEGLRQLGNSYWSATGVSGSPKLGSAGANGFGNLMSSTIEGSNVDITEELVNLIAAQRNFQANSKALDTQSQISETIFNIRS